MGKKWDSFFVLFIYLMANPRFNILETCQKAQTGRPVGLAYSYLLSRTVKVFKFSFCCVMSYVQVCFCLHSCWENKNNCLFIFFNSIYYKYKYHHKKFNMLKVNSWMTTIGRSGQNKNLNYPSLKYDRRSPII